MSKIIFDLDDTLYVSDELRSNREKVILDFLGDKVGEYFELKKENSTMKSLEILGISLSNSSKFCIKETLVQLGIFNLIDSYYSAQDFGKIKPCEECFFMVDKGDICVGNNFKKDLEIPKQKGAITIFVGGFHKDADKSIKNIYELKNILKGGYDKNEY
ncbi:MAG: hypothetical protein QT05_C0041G0005 [archaeon GW2011_AR13]|nr:MAG: hypothetical protein QT05_C0041G0005 [archaeon GW2011_AR13]